MPTVPISKVCPQCGAAEFKNRKSDKWVAFANNRLCTACQTLYAPPTPVWGAILFILIGIPLAAFGAYAVVWRINQMNALHWPAMGCEAFLGFIGLSAIGLGARALIWPGKV